MYHSVIEYEGLRPEFLNSTQLYSIILISRHSLRIIKSVLSKKTIIIIILNKF